MTEKLTKHPLTEATFFILLSIAQKPKHGYAILKDVETLSGGRIKFSTGTLYGAISRLLEQQWIEQIENDQPPDTGRPRKDYALTMTGRSVLNAEIGRMENVLASAKRRFGEDIG
ncbi:MAG: PadR family transcriptional regulator [Chloroflexi bacterium]|nr:PadR family transcriptional regulator [Chloroflexota bacterium]MCC6897267.1 helix-turn-helix transcriptional regulator [Anaerolineae bacterium]